MYLVSKSKVRVTAAIEPALEESESDESHCGVSATHDPSPTRGRHALQRDAARARGQWEGVRARWGAGRSGEILLGHRPGRSRTLPRATCKLVPTAKILPRARHSCVGYPTTASPTLQALSYAHPVGLKSLTKGGALIEGFGEINIRILLL